MRQDLHINNHDIEALCIETINNKGKKFFNLTKKNSGIPYMVGDFLDYSTSSKGKTFQI